MDKNSAISLIQNVFQNPFDHEYFITFAKNLFNFLDTERNFIYRGNFIPDAYKPYIHTLERIGKYEDVEDNKIDVLIVHLKKEHSIEHARTMQRNFIAWYLGGSRGGELKDAALVAFHTDNPDDWRFSLVKMDYQIVESETGKIKTKTELTPARRFSFLVGKNENSHTAQRQLLPTLQDDKNNPLLSDFEKAFNIEVVTQEFFERYCGLFLDVKEALEKIIVKNQAISQDFTDKGVDPVDFSKKLLGQIVFLYFLQKKGWFGVGRDDNWGTGPKNFLRLLFEKMIADYKNFFNDILEPLFYEALAKERDKDFYSRFNCKIPFLNGGLFDPISDYDWVHTDILLPDDLFSNHVRTEEGDIGTGILDIFDRYNFTVKEDEPLEKEVAVDPEMLGKVFENLLEVKDRKSKGTYYTPREIVHYMCQESLINYLVNECEGKVNRKDIETLIQYGESAVEHDGRVEQEGKETETYSYKLPESIRKNAQLIDDKLKNIRVCDPAIGSGAFPVGMMNEIIRTRNTLTNYLEDKEDRSIYNFKRDAIQNSLYGVDIDPGAVEIAKLRLWLSLVVDEEDIKHIKPLPNLDYKIMQGNSLLEEFEGVKLFDEELISKPAIDDDKYRDEIKERMAKLQRDYIQLHSAGKLTNIKKSELELELKKQGALLKHLSQPVKPKSESTGLFDIFSEAKKKAQELKQLHKEFFEASQKTKKDELKRRIEKLEWDLIETSLSEQNKISSLKKLEQYKRTNIKPFFLWRLNFAEVFQEKGGFDVVIANPPYISHVNYGKQDKEAISKTFSTFSGRADLYVAFYEQGIRLAKENGIVTYISPNKFFRSGYGDKLRGFLYRETRILNIIDFGDAQIFDATTYPAIVTLKKGIAKSYKFAVLKTDTSSDLRIKDKYSTFDKEYLNNSIWSFNNLELENIWQKVKKDTVFLKEYIDNQFYRGIVTGLNDAFIIDGDQRKKIILENPEADAIIKPYLRGKDVKRWKSDTKFYIIFTYHGIDITKYPAIKDYLLPFKDRLEERATSKNHKWYELQQPQTGIYRKYEKNKIISTDIAKRCEFTFDKTGAYIDATIFCIPIDDLYLLGLLNSRLLESYFRSISSTIRGNFLRFKKIYLDILPIKNTSEEQINKIIPLVAKLLDISSLNKSDSLLPAQTQIHEIEKQIDHLVYELYGLTVEEVKIVEENV